MWKSNDAKTPAMFLFPVKCGPTCGFAYLEQLPKLKKQTKKSEKKKQHGDVDPRWQTRRITSRNSLQRWCVLLLARSQDWPEAPTNVRRNFDIHPTAWANLAHWGRMIIPGIGYVVNNHGDRFRPFKWGNVGPLPNGLNGLASEWVDTPPVIGGTQPSAETFCIFLTETSVRFRMYTTWSTWICYLYQM